MLQYNSYARELDVLLSANLKASATEGEQYVVRTVVLRLWDQVFRSEKAIRILALAMDQLTWPEVVEHVRDLILALDNAMETVSIYRQQNTAPPTKDLINSIALKAEFLGESVTKYAKNYGNHFRPAADFGFVLTVLTDVDWPKIAHLTELDAERTAVTGLFGDMKFYDFAPSKLEQALKV